MSNGPEEHPNYGHDPLKKTEPEQPVDQYGPPAGNYDAAQQYPGYGQPQQNGAYGQVPQNYAQNPDPQSQYGVPQNYAQQNPGYMTEPTEGKTAANTSLVLGIVGIFFFSLIFGMIALHYANKAEKLGENATAGRVLGWVDIGIGIFSILFTAFFLFLGISAGFYESSTY